MKRLLVAGFVMLLALVGCSDDPKPKFGEPPESSPPISSPGPSPSSTTPTQSAQPNGQAQAIDAFFSAISESLSTGDASQFLSLATGRCVNCGVLQDNLAEAYADGGYVLGGKWEILSATPVETQGAVIWNVRLSTAREEWFDAEDHLVKTVKPSIQTFAVSLKASSPGYLVQEMKLR